MPGLRDRLRAFWEAMGAAPSGPSEARGPDASRGGPRVAGPPRSSNGASSFHLIWNLPGGRDIGRIVEVAATLEIVEPPRVDSLYFWALQVDFADEHGVMWGGGHTGLQWNRRFPQRTATNWGGYASQGRGGSVLPGSVPELYAFPGDPNTMAFAWSARRPYRFRVYRSPEVAGAWRASVIDVGSGDETVLRDLFHPGGPHGRHGKEPGYLFRPLVWSEVFADCDAPSVVVRWNDLAAVTEEGAVLSPWAVTVNYQSHRAGGCANTSARSEGRGVLQMTNTPREVAQGQRLELGDARP